MKAAFYEILDYIYTQTISKGGFGQFQSYRNSSILTDLILIILTRLRSANCDALKPPKIHLLRLFGYKRDIEGAMEIEQFLELSRRGFFLAPGETEKHFCLRLALSERLFKAPAAAVGSGRTMRRVFWDWAKETLKNSFDIFPDHFLVFFSKKRLRLFEAGATWTYEESGVKTGVIQLQDKLQRGRYLGLCALDEVLSHEAVHLSRIAFNEPIFEEMIAFMASGNIFRQIFGPVFRRPIEPLLFLIPIILLPIHPVAYSLFAIAASFFLFRLFYWRRIFTRAFRRIFKAIRNKKQTMAVLVRLSDQDIKTLSKMPPKQVHGFFATQAEHSLRMEVIYRSYFCR